MATEQRRAPRMEVQRRVELNVIERARKLQGSTINLSEGGICLRLREALEVRSAVRCRLFGMADGRPMQCDGRIAWVVQRLDLRGAPPFVYDVGIEFIDAPARLREFAAELGVPVRSTRPLTPSSLPAGRTSRVQLEPLVLNDRTYVPRVRLEAGTPSKRWHLVVMADGVPCLSQRFAMEREAVAAWQRFRRSAAAPPARKPAPRRRMKK